MEKKTNYKEKFKKNHNVESNQVQCQQEKSTDYSTIKRNFPKAIDY